MDWSRHPVVVVTGASAGVGRATVRELARRGASVVLIARGAAGLAGAQADVEALGRPALAMPVDVADAMCSKWVVSPLIRQPRQITPA